MIDKQQLQTLVEEKLQNTDYELIVLKVSGQNEILVEVDKLDGVDVDFCAELNHYLVEQLDAQGLEDYSLEVGSVSLTAPFVTNLLICFLLAERRTTKEITLFKSIKFMVFSVT